MASTIVPLSAANLQPRHKPTVSENQHRRRDVLGRIAGEPVAVVPVAASAVDAEDPHVAWGVEERRRRARHEALTSNDPAYATIEEQDAADMAELEVFEDLMERIVNTPARTLAGVQEQVRYALYCNEEWHGDREELVTAALQNAMATLVTLTGRA